MTEFFSVILNAGLTPVFQNLIVGRPDVRKARGQAVICEQSSRKILSLSWKRVFEGQERVNKNYSFIPTLSPSLIREGDNIASLFPLHTSLKSKLAFTLAKGATHVARLNNYRKIAFTLAEVLITLGIIGVVAAMTMPSLIQNARNRELESGLKKGASVIGQALNMYQAENGVPITSDIGGHELKPVLMKYFNVIRDCGLGFEDADSACVSYMNNANTYKNFTGTVNFDVNMFDDGQFVLNDGSLILLNNTNSGTDLNTYISIDVNGYNKRPNRLGQDLFMFQLDNAGRLIPMGAEGTAFYDENDAYCSKTSNNSNNGAGCTYRALSDPTFWKSLP